MRDDTGLEPERPKRLSAVAFLDLTGFTPLTESLGDHAAAQQAARLAELVQETVNPRQGRVVKLLGDGVMLHFRDVASSGRAGLS